VQAALSDILQGRAMRLAGMPDAEAATDVVTTAAESPDLAMRLDGDQLNHAAHWSKSRTLFVLTLIVAAIAVGAAVIALR
jgi:hypothetical protein